MTLAAPQADLAPATTVAGAGRSRRGLALGLSAAVLLACVVASIAFGARDVGLADIIDGLFAVDPQTVAAIAVRERIPRTALALVAGAALGVAGALLQAVTRNPLADAGLLGINAGGCLAMAAGMAWFGLGDVDSRIWAAFVGAAVAGLVVHGIASLGRDGATPVKTAVAGAAVAAALVTAGASTATVAGGGARSRRRAAARALAVAVAKRCFSRCQRTSASSMASRAARICEQPSCSVRVQASPCERCRLRSLSRSLCWNACSLASRASIAEASPIVVQATKLRRTASSSLLSSTSTWRATTRPKIFQARSIDCFSCSFTASNRWAYSACVALRPSAAAINDPALVRAMFTAASIAGLPAAASEASARWDTARRRLACIASSCSFVSLVFAWARSRTALA